MKAISVIFDVANQRVIGGTDELTSGIKVTELDADDIVVITCEGSYTWSVIKQRPRIADALTSSDGAES